MPCSIKRLTPEGLQPVDYHAESLADAARYELDGVYTVTNTYDTTKVLKLSAHLDRLEDSARREGIPVTLDRSRIRAALREMIETCGYGDVRFRITIPRDQPNEAVLSIEPFAPPPADVYARGVRVVTLPESRRDNPAAKTTGWMERRSALQRAMPPGIYEGLLLSERGDLLEGMSSNFYAIVAGELRTAVEGILAGIAQQVVLEIAPTIIPVERKPVHVEDIPRLDEAFISSASRGIVPVVEIDGVRIGDGAPGPFTRALREAYLAWVRTNLEEL